MITLEETSSKVTSGWMLSGEEKEKALQHELDCFGNYLKPRTIVECIHCGDKFRVQEAVVLKPYKGFSNPMVMCKNYPECDGNLIDMWPTKSLKKTMQVDGFETQIIQMSDKEIEALEKRSKSLPKLKEGETPELGVWYRG